MADYFCFPFAIHHWLITASLFVRVSQSSHIQHLHWKCIGLGLKRWQQIIAIVVVCVRVVFNPSARWSSVTRANIVLLKTPGVSRSSWIPALIHSVLATLFSACHSRSASQYSRLLLTSKSRLKPHGAAKCRLLQHSKTHLTCQHGPLPPPDIFIWRIVMVLTVFLWRCLSAFQQSCNSLAKGSALL